MSNADRLTELQARLREFTAEREWSQFHDPKNLAMAIASEAGELLAHLRWVQGPVADAYVSKADNRNAIEHEVADVAIALLLFCDRTQIDLLEVIANKIELNRERYPVDAARGKPERPQRATGPAS